MDELAKTLIQYNISISSVESFTVVTLQQC